MESVRIKRLEFGVNKGFLHFSMDKANCPVTMRRCPYKAGVRKAGLDCMKESIKVT